jgi:very-short-patch-repair endonuclease
VKKKKHPLKGRKKSNAARLAMKKAWEKRRLTPVSQKTRQKMSKSLRDYYKKNKCKPFSVLHRKRLSKSQKASFQNPQKRPSRLRWTQACHRNKGGPAYQLLRKLLEPVGYQSEYTIENFMVDFALPDKKVVIEVDGRVHQATEIRVSDKLRDQKLKKKGWRVIRVKENYLNARY